MGGADGAAIDELISVFLAEPGSEAQLSDCKTHLLLACKVGEEDFEGASKKLRKKLLQMRMTSLLSSSLRMISMIPLKSYHLLWS